MGREARVSLLITAKQYASKVLDDVRAAVIGTKRAAEDVGPASERAASRATRSFESIRDVAARAGEVIGGLFAAHKVIEAADAWKLAEGQLRIVTDTTDEVRAAQEALFNVSQRTRTGFTSNVALYARLARSTKDLNLSSQQLVDVTEAVARAALLSGAGVQQVENGYYQLGQALALGKLQAQDARSIIEDLPRLGQAMAEGMGLSMGEFRQQMLAGKITAEAMVTSMQKVLPTLREEMANVPLTVGQAMVQLKNAFTRYVGETDRGLGATSALSAGISFLATNMSVLGDVGFAVAIARVAAWTVRIGEATGTAIAAATGLTAYRAAVAAAAAAETGLVIETAAASAGFVTEATVATGAAAATGGFSIAAGIAAGAARALGVALRFMGGWIGLLITGVVLVGSYLLNLRNQHRAAAEATAKHTAEVERAKIAQNEEAAALDRKIAAIEAEREALRKGGTKAADRVHDEADAFEKAAAAWKKWTSENESAKEASLTFEQALKSRNGVALGLLNREQALAMATRALREETEAARKAEEQRTKAADPHKQMAETIDALRERIGIGREYIDLNERNADSLIDLSRAEDEARTLLKHGNITLKERLELLRALNDAVEERKKKGLLTPEEAYTDPTTGKPKAPKVMRENPVGAMMQDMAPVRAADNGTMVWTGQGWQTKGPVSPNDTGGIPFTPKPMDGLIGKPGVVGRIGSAMKDAVAEGERLDNIIANMTSHTFEQFGSAVEDAFAAMVDGSMSAGQAFEAAMLGALASVAEGFGQFFLAKATAALGEGLMGDPAGFAAAAEYTAAATGMFAVAGLMKGLSSHISGHGSGGGGGRSGATNNANTLNRAASLNDATLVVEGGLLDMSDPKQAQALANALTALSNRRVRVVKR